MALVDAIVSFAVEKIGEQLIQEAVFLHGVRGDVESIQRELRRMQAFLQVSERKQKDGDDERVKNWVVEVRDAAFDAEDAIGMFILRTERKRRRGIIKKSVFFLGDLLTLHKIGTQIGDIKTKLTEISDSKSSYGIPEIIQGGGPSSPHRRLQDYRRNAALAAEEDVVGFERDVNALVTRLTEGHSRRCVVSVVAMGGAGKTTVARKVYDHQRVKTHFGGSAAWVTVSQNTVAKELLQDIAEQVMKMKKDEARQLSVKDLQDGLSEFLKEKRYLIVLDDIWDIEAWDQLRAAFPDGENGSRIMFTTRNVGEVALRADPDPENRPHELPLLNSEESWKLFLKRVFPWEKGDQTGSCPLELEELGKQIVAKCSGLPLAIAVIGGLLSAKEQTPSSWRNVLDSLPWQLSEQESVHCSDILALSYYHLPHYLKPCFLYMGVFPEDEEIQAEKLMSLWVAEGFIQPRGQQIKEEVALDCLLELIGRSMIQVASRGYDGSIIECRIHDLLRDLAIAEARRDHFLEIGSNASSPSFIQARRLAIHHETTHNRYESLNHNNPKLHSLLCFTKSLPNLPVRGAKFLRVLDLARIEVGNYWVFSVLGALIHLKYLTLRAWWETHIIPESIGKLYNLETFNVVGYSYGARLPKAIWNMHRLRHLNVSNSTFVSHPRLNHLRNLHTLYLRAGRWIEKDTLSTLTSLRVLGVLEGFRPYGEILSYSIEKLNKLQSLELSDGWVETFTIPPLMHHVDLRKMTFSVRLEKLPDLHEYPPNLTKLILRKTKLDEDPMSTLEKLPNLQVLLITDDAYRGKKMISSAQGFPRLKSLVLSDLSALEEWRVEKRALPALVRLYISSCRGLKMLPEGLRGVTTLRTMEIESMPNKFCGRLRKSEGEDWYKIAHIPSLKIPEQQEQTGRRHIPVHVADIPRATCCLPCL